MHGSFGCENQPRRAVRDLRAVARRHVTEFAVKKGLELGQLRERLVGTRANILRDKFLKRRRQEHRGGLFVEPTDLLGGHSPLMTAQRKGVLLFAT